MPREKNNLYLISRPILSYPCHPRGRDFLYIEKWLFVTKKGRFVRFANKFVRFANAFFSKSSTFVHSFD